MYKVRLVVFLMGNKIENYQKTQQLNVTACV